jgi:hypothetical protein
VLYHSIAGVMLRELSALMAVAALSLQLPSYPLEEALPHHTMTFGLVPLPNHRPDTA